MNQMPAKMKQAHKNIRITMLTEMMSMNCSPFSCLLFNRRKFGFIQKLPRSHTSSMFCVFAAASPAVTNGLFPVCSMTRLLPAGPASVAQAAMQKTYLDFENRRQYLARRVRLDVAAKLPMGTNARRKRRIAPD
ncbi:MAG: hypothetical protein LBQ62_05930 [Candidatus Accumulibacter sp.]|nr:hypothetical protein [Accumulibacter sp.]